MKPVLRNEVEYSLETHRDIGTESKVNYIASVVVSRKVKIYHFVVQS